MKFQRASRLTSQAEFRRVFQKAGVSRDRYFKVLSRGNDQHFARLGMAVSLKVSPKAVERNRLKRVIRESFRHYFASSDGGPGLDLVVLPRREAVTICNATLRASLNEHWQRSVASADRRNSGHQNNKGTEGNH